MKEDKKKMMLGFLKENGRSSTFLIETSTKTDHTLALKYLGELEDEGKVEKQIETRAIYWILTTKGEASLVKI